HPHRRADRGRDRRGRPGADRGAPAPRADRRQPRHAGRRPGRRRARPPAPAEGRGRGDQRPVRRHPRRAAGHREEGRGRGREEAPVTLWWIGAILLLVVVFPVVVYLLHGVLTAARSIVRPTRRIADTAAAASQDLDATVLLLRTQEEVQ